MHYFIYILEQMHTLCIKSFLMHIPYVCEVREVEWLRPISPEEISPLKISLQIPCYPNFPIISILYYYKCTFSYVHYKKSVLFIPSYVLRLTYYIINSQTILHMVLNRGKTPGNTCVIIYRNLSINIPPSWIYSSTRISAARLKTISSLYILNKNIIKNSHFDLYNIWI